MSVDTPIAPPVLRQPILADASAIWLLAKETGVLDLNPSYTYLMLCRNFKETCVVAELDGRLAGFITAYILPAQQDTLFVWQVGVSAPHRGQGLATKMLHELLRRPSCRNILYLETTISPSNHSSQALFKKLANHLGTDCLIRPCFNAADFPDQHEDEWLFKIGPLVNH